MAFDISTEVFQNPIMLSIGTLISEDLSFLVGLMAIQLNKISSLGFIFFYTFGVIIGDIMLYSIGVFARVLGHTKIGAKLLSLLPKSFQKQYDQSEKDEFSKFEIFLIFTRFLPGTRIPTYSYCGLTKYPIWKFTLILLFSTLVYASVGVALITLSQGFDLENSPWYIKFLNALAVSFITIFVFKIGLSIRNLKTKFGMIIKPLLVKIRRLEYPEFWPPVLFYLPVVPSFIFNLIRYRGFSGVLVSNPLIEMSGLIGENKSDIDIILKKNANKHRLPLIKFDKEIDSDIEEKINELGLKYPFIIKPDSGMRGTGVSLVHTKEELDIYLESSKNRVVIQEYFPFKNEWGVFYYRLPGETKGNIFSITNKVFPKVIGDGKSSVLELLWKDHFIKCRFDWLYDSIKNILNTIPEEDEVVELTNRGSHSKGCLFLDGSQYMNSIAMDKMSQVFDKIDGFHIGRIDVRFESLEAIENGEFKIIEINGTGGESSNYYDPRMSYINVYKTMINQWNLAFKIGDLNIKHKVPKGSVKAFLKTIIKYRKGDA